MIITCEECATRFILDDALIKPAGSKVRCSKCRHVFTAFPAEIRDTAPTVDIPGQTESETQQIAFDAPYTQDDSDSEVSQENGFNLNGDSNGEDLDLESTDIDFSEIEFDEPEFKPDLPEQGTYTDTLDIEDQDNQINALGQDFDEDGLDFEIDESEPDTQDFNLEEIEDAPPLGSSPLETEATTADIEISFDQNDDTDLELDSISFDMDDSAAKTPDTAPVDHLELDIKKPAVPELEFEADPHQDPVIEEGHIESSEDSQAPLADEPVQSQEEIIEQPPDLLLDNDEAPDEQETADQEIEQTVLEQDKFAEYDNVLEQESEPEDTDITIPSPEAEDNAFPLEPSPPSTGNNGIEAEAQKVTYHAPTGTSSSVHSAQSVRQKRGAKKKKGMSLPVKILLVLFLLVLAAYVAIMRLSLTIPGMPDIEIPFITAWLQPKQAPAPPPNPVPDEPSIDGRFVSNKSAGDLFIVTGKIKNPSRSAVSYIQVKGTLITENNAKSDTLVAYCGNIIPEETLKSGNISDITTQMGVKQGNQNTNVNIKPGASVMFMLVFSNLPKDLANYTVVVHGFEPVEE